MSGTFKSTVLKSTPKRPPGPQFGGQNPTLSISSDGKRLPHDPMCLSPEASNPPPLLGEGTADGPSLLDALASMGLLLLTLACKLSESMAPSEADAILPFPGLRRQ